MDEREELERKKKLEIEVKYNSMKKEHEKLNENLKCVQQEKNVLEKEKTDLEEERTILNNEKNDLIQVL